MNFFKRIFYGSYEKHLSFYAEVRRNAFKLSSVSPLVWSSDSYTPQFDLEQAEPFQNHAL